MSAAVLEAPPVEQGGDSTTARTDTPPAAQALLEPTPSGRLARLAEQLGPYVGYAGYFVGAGLISGGIVHYPLEPARYGQLAAVGVVVFAVATVFNEFVLAAERPARSRMLRLVGASLLLSMGIGMLSGGIQHFSDFPQRAATLVPVGLVLSYAAFQARNASNVRAALLSITSLAVLLLAAVLYVALHAVAATSTPPLGEHAHGAAEPAPAAAEGGHGDPVQDGHTPGHAPAGGQTAVLEAPTAAATPAELEEMIRQLKIIVDGLGVTAR